MNLAGLVPYQHNHDSLLKLLFKWDLHNPLVLKMTLSEIVRKFQLFFIPSSLKFSVILVFFLQTRKKYLRNLNTQKREENVFQDDSLTIILLTKTRAPANITILRYFCLIIQTIFQWNLHVSTF